MLPAAPSQLDGTECLPTLPAQVLFEEMAKLMRYKVDSLEEFPARITYSDDKDRYLLCKECFAKVDQD